VVWLLLLGSLAIPTAEAQVMIDVSRITCDQCLLSKIAAPRVVGVWLSGFYAGKQGRTAVDIQKLEENAEKIAEYCGSNREAILMSAVEHVLGGGP
jgi:acid stress chaperone HdeB